MEGIPWARQASDNGWLAYGIVHAIGAASSYDLRI